MKVLLTGLVLAASMSFSTHVMAEEAHTENHAEAQKDANSGHATQSPNDSQDNSKAHAHVDQHPAGKLFPQPKPNLENSALPGKVELVEPTFWSTLSGAATLKWKEVADAESYHVQVATDPNFKWLTIDAPLYKGTSYEVKNLEAGKHYYWRVAATNTTKWPASIKGPYTKSMFATK